VGVIVSGRGAIGTRRDNRFSALIACSFKDGKRGGWQWEQTNMTDPDRATRLWLAIAVANQSRVVSVGSAAEVAAPARMLADLPATHPARQRSTVRPQPRQLSCFRRGVLLIITTLLRMDQVPDSRLIPEPWPERRDTHAAEGSSHIPQQDAT
jgi:hypothetical protein